MFGNSRAGNFTIEHFTWTKNEMPYTLEQCKLLAFGAKQKALLPLVCFVLLLLFDADVLPQRRSFFWIYNNFRCALNKIIIRKMSAQRSIRLLSPFSVVYVWHKLNLTFLLNRKILRLLVSNFFGLLIFYCTFICWAFSSAREKESNEINSTDQKIVCVEC